MTDSFLFGWGIPVIKLSTLILNILGATAFAALMWRVWTMPETFLDKILFSGLAFGAVMGFLFPSESSGFERVDRWRVPVYGIGKDWEVNLIRFSGGLLLIIMCLKVFVGKNISLPL